jgi:hypothetical protein
MAVQGHVLDKVRSLHYDSRRFLGISLLLLSLLMVDYYVSSAIDSFKVQVSSSPGILLFSIIAIVCTLGQYIILLMTKDRLSEYNIKDSQIVALQKAMSIVVYILTALLAINVLQIYISSWYYTHLISAIVILSYGFTSILMGILTYRLLNWFKLKRSIITLIYGIAAASFTINAVVSAALFEQLLVEKPLIFTPNSTIEFNFECDTNPFKCFITNFQSYTMYAYIFSMWCGSVILLHHNIRRVGKAKFWVLITIPVVAFYIAYVSAYNELYQMSSTVTKEETPIIKMLLIILLTALLGIINGIGFRSVGKVVKSSHQLREYMTCTAYGVVFYFVAANSTVAAAGYPPFGVVSISFVPLSALLILIGLYHSAISLANDSQLRREIWRSVTEQSKLLQSIAEAQVQQEMERKIMRLTNASAKLIADETGIQPSLSIDEANQYLHDVMREVEHIKKSSNTS